MTRLHAIKKVINAENSWLYPEVLSAVERIFTFSDNSPEIAKIVHAYTVGPPSEHRLDRKECRNKIIEIVRRASETTNRVKITAIEYEPFIVVSVLRRMHTTGFIMLDDSDEERITRVMDAFAWESADDRIFEITLRDGLNELWFTNWIDPLIDNISVVE